MYRPLLASEIEQLQRQRVSAADWQAVTVREDFDPARVCNVRMTGQIRLGRFGASGGVYDSTIEDVEIDDDALVQGVSALSHYHIGRGARLINIGELTTDGPTAFGNGTQIEVLNEGGGRELPIFDQLSAQLAYLLVCYQHDRELQERLRQMINDYVASKSAARGTVGAFAQLRHCGIIRNIAVGEYAVLCGAVHLEEGSIASCQSDPVEIGPGVIAKQFIILSGSRVDSGALLERCFIGQGVRIGKQFSAENSAFFANCEGFHGEACSIYGGPYTVTHHKSTLLIAGMFSFFNAGSGTNQSNHMYKLGPLHQGILERGAKTGSFSYLLWPSRIGAFSVVTGKHAASFDTSDLPFSYIVEKEGKSLLSPGMNLFTVGTRRDSVKWPKRDRRKDPAKLDLIHFDLFSPYTVGRMLQAIRILTHLIDTTPREQEFVNFKGVQIKRLMLRNGRKFYETAVKTYIGITLTGKIQSLGNPAGWAELLQGLKPVVDCPSAKWVDISGLMAPESEIAALMTDLKSNAGLTMEQFHNRLRTLYEAYPALTWSWFVNMLREERGLELTQLTQEQLITLLQDSAASQIKFTNMILTDAEKEFDQDSRIGYGIDGDEAIRRADFEAVRGTFAHDKFVIELQREIETLSEEIESLTRLIRTLA